MPSTTRLTGYVLIVLGLASYVLTGMVSVTALIPAFFGVVFLLLAMAARGEAMRKHMVHAALAIALIGLLATLARLIPALADGQLMRPAVLAQLAMSIVLLVYIVLGVRSFIDARRARRG